MSTHNDKSIIRGGSSAVIASPNPQGKGQIGFLLDWAYSGPRAVVAKPAPQLLADYFTSLLVLTSIALVLSLGGIYSIMSFTVTQRTREIAIRMALGSSRAGVVGSVLRRPARQVVIGVAAGVGMMTLAVVGLGENVSWDDAAYLGVYATIMMAVCMTASVVPARLDEHYDNGPVLRQRKVPVLPDDTPETLQKRVLAEEHVIYAEVLADIVAGKIALPVALP